ncbi:MAG: hypothetical protein LBS74_00210 [Oscillospiraceae bacterium]|nr:hypothetical protein [Oscillospiraceae bacterium]
MWQGLDNANQNWIISPAEVEPGEYYIKNMETGQYLQLSSRSERIVVIG